MERKALSVRALASLVLLSSTYMVSAQSLHRAPAATGPQPNAQLPVTRVSLYKSGVGFFEHAGQVTGNQTVTIEFTTAQLNDVLQSLTAIDLGGGRIAGAGYNSTTPIEQQLKALPLGLGEDASTVDFFNAVRGARVEVHAGTSVFIGRLLNIEVHEVPPEKEGQPPVETRWITVVSEAGAVRTVQLTPTTEVRLLDATLHTDVNRYLQLLADTRNQGLRRLALQDNGTGARELRVSYISEVPVWKSTYRILFTDPVSTGKAKQTATLQGWSVVDNTTGTDWMNVQLSLIAGAPQSFIQPLSVPYYNRRPEIGLPQEAQITPQTHESGDAALTSIKVPADIKMLKEEGAPAPQAAGIAGMSGMGGPINGRFVGGGRSIHGAGPMAAMNASVSVTLPEPMIAYEDAAANSVAPQATTSTFDDFFEYKLSQPITIRKNESALVPILQTKIDAERVTLWSPAQPQPLRALWITNTSDLTLDRGSFSIVEGGNFGGEGLLDPVHPKERRLLSYAADQAIRVSTDHANNTHRVDRITVAKGVLKQSTVDVNEVEYLVRNAAPEARTVVVEHPVRAGWTIDSDPKPTETTPTLNRFRIEVPAGQTVRLHIGERHPGVVTVRLADQNDDQIAFYLRGASPAILQQMEPVLTARRTLAEIDTQINAKNAAIRTLVEDQGRVRANLSALKGTAEERTLAKRYTAELNSQEDTLATLRHDLDGLQARRQMATAELSSRIEALQVEEKL